MGFSTVVPCAARRSHRFEARVKFIRAANVRTVNGTVLFRRSNRSYKTGGARPLGSKQFAAANKFRVVCLRVPVKSIYASYDFISLVSPVYSGK